MISLVHVNDGVDQQVGKQEVMQGDIRNKRPCVDWSDAHATWVISVHILRWLLEEHRS